MKWNLKNKLHRWMMENFSNFDKKLGDIIRNARKNKNLLQADLADMLNISPQQLQKYESGKNKINVEKLYKIAEVLNISITDFIQPFSLPFSNFNPENFSFKDLNSGNSSNSNSENDLDEELKMLIKNYNGTKSIALKNLLLFSSNIFCNHV